MREALEKTLRHEIPLTAAMDLRVLEASGDLVRLAVPLGPNLNHKRTAFGGSLYSGAVLAGWGLLWCALREQELKAQIIIAASEVEYLAPVTADFEAVCVGDLDEVDSAFQILRRKRKAKVSLQTAVSCRGVACVSFFGVYGLIGV